MFGFALLRSLQDSSYSAAQLSRQVACQPIQRERLSETRTAQLAPEHSERPVPETDLATL